MFVFLVLLMFSKGLQKTTFLLPDQYLSGFPLTASKGVLLFAQDLFYFALLVFRESISLLDVCFFFFLKGA